jgi:hypothetical protein
MNQRLRELAKQAQAAADQQWLEAGYPSWENYQEVFAEDYNKKFAQLIINDCVAKCQQVAEDADQVSKGKFVTDHGRMLHQGMFGGAKNCAAEIRAHFGVEE